MATRTRLFVLVLGLIAIADISVGLYLESTLRQRLEERVDEELIREARLAAQMLDMSEAKPTIEAVDAVADRAGDAAQVRVTIIAADGVVLGDSWLDPARIEGVERHHERAEIVQAFAEGVGRSRRLSTTVGAQLRYVALVHRQSETPVAVRVALPLSAIDDAVASMRAVLVGAGLFSLLLSGLLLVVFMRIFSRAVQDVVTTATAAATSSAHIKASPRASDPDVSLKRMARDLEKAMSALATERDRFEAVLQTMDQAVIGLDEGRRVSTVNRAARTLLDLADDVEGRRLLEAVRLPGLRELVDHAQRDGSAQAEFEAAGGKRVQGRATAQGEGGATTIVVHDVTEIRRLERVRRDFVANVSHELRTPISVVKANAETLLSGALEDPERARQFTDAIMRHANRLGRLVGDLLDISRIEAGRYPLAIQQTQLGPAVDHVLETLGVEAKARGTKLTNGVAADTELAADGKALEHVLLNLVDNAIKYSGPNGEVLIRAHTDGDRVRVEVRDDGPGIDPADRKRVFERFYRVDSGRSREMGGTGLGLSIAKNLVEFMGGSVGVDPLRPRGSVFWFTLPREQQKED